jgi:hypothetical protein|tara:strand:- start:403 stop:666 length:264 start_codon:yes stop_codon:yes gene_type:complete
VFVNISAGAADKVVNFNGDIYAVTTEISGIGTVNFNGDVIDVDSFNTYNEPEKPIYFFEKTYCLRFNSPGLQLISNCIEAPRFYKER